MEVQKIRRWAGFADEVVFEGFEMLLKIAEGVAVAAGDGVDGDAKGGGDLLEGEPAPELQGHDFALVFIQLRECIRDDGGGFFFLRWDIKGGCVFARLHAATR